MNADIIKRLVRGIAEGSQGDLDRLANKVVETERKTGHRRLADELGAILNESRKRPHTNGHALTERTGSLRELPQSRRHGEQLATLIPHDELEHDMVLPAATEERFARIECEFAARERLGVHGLRPRKTILLYGPPGCSKSFGAKRLVWNIGLPLMKVRFDVLISSYFGESALNLRSIFVSAKERRCMVKRRKGKVQLIDATEWSRPLRKNLGKKSRELSPDSSAPRRLSAGVLFCLGRSTRASCARLENPLP